MSRTLVTGASTGLGLELARLFAADGHDLVLTARSADNLRALSRALSKDFEVEVVCVAQDLTVPEGPEALLKTLADSGLTIDVLVNNAGFGAYGPFLDRPWETYRDLINLNISAVTRLTHALLPGIKEAAGYPSLDRTGDPPRRSGRTSSQRLGGIMNVSSTAAFQPGPLMAAYFASKAFILSFTEALHEELKGSGVNVCAFCPGPTRTDFFLKETMIPLGPITEQDVAEFERRDAKRMEAGLAAQVGYRGFRAGKSLVIPGRRNRLLAWLAPRLPRGLVRRITHRVLQK